MDTQINNHKNMRKFLFGFFILGLGGLLLTGFILSNTPEAVQNSDSSVFSRFLGNTFTGNNAPEQPTGSGEIVELEDPMINMLEVDEVREVVIDEEDALVAQLTDVSGGTGIGTAYLLRDEGTLYHYVTVTLPGVEGENFYESWLVNEETNEFYSTGQLQKGANDTFELGYSENSMLDGYNKVVITLETVYDDTPEKHVLEGTVVERILE